MKEELKKIKIFTDGSCKNNGKPNATGGYGIYFPDGEFPNISKPFTINPITNQRSELWAIFIAMKITVDDFDKIIIYSDSLYSINCLTEWSNKWLKNGWKNSQQDDVKNRNILEPMVILYNENLNKFRFNFVKSHTGRTDILSIGNENADKLATEGLTKDNLNYIKIVI